MYIRWRKCFYSVKLEKENKENKFIWFTVKCFYSINLFGYEVKKIIFLGFTRCKTEEK